MNDIAPNPVSAGVSIVAAKHIALRYLFISPGRWNDGRPATSKSLLGLNDVHDQIEQSKDAAKYVDPVASFYADVTIPFTTRRQLPVVALTERLPKDGGPMRPLVEIDIGLIRMEWERGTVEVSPTTIPALFSDCLTFFDSGHVIYAPAFQLQYPWAMQEASAPASHDAAAQHVTALTSLVGSPGLTHRRDLDRMRSQILFKFADDKGGLDLVAFIKRRLAFLRNEKNRASVFAEVMEPALTAAGWTRAQRARAFDGIATMAWDGLRSASLEIIGAARHHEIVKWCKDAEDGTIAVGVGERAIAALGQNVLDVQNQDELEVVDSLLQARVSEEHALLIHPKLAVLYSRASRSFTEMCDAIGGCPYVMLTNVVLAYNEYMLDQSAGLIDTIKQASRAPRWGLGTSKTARLRADLQAREQLFVNQTLNFLPNIFRYPAEREMFKEVEEQRGLTQRADAFERFTRNLYELRQSHADLAEREGTRVINLWLLALGIFQVSGLFLAALALDDFRSGPVREALWSGFGMFSALGVGVALSAALRQR
jgi:hypothetical protein